MKWPAFGRRGIVCGEVAGSAKKPNATGAAESGVLLEREDDLRSLAESLAPVRQPAEGNLVLVSGEAGIGKTALVRRFCGSHDDTTVLWGACEPLLTPRPLGPALDIAAAGC